MFLHMTIISPYAIPVCSLFPTTFPNVHRWTIKFPSEPPIVSDLSIWNHHQFSPWNGFVHHVSPCVHHLFFITFTPFHHCSPFFHMEIIISPHVFLCFPYEIPSLPIIFPSFSHHFPIVFHRFSPGCHEGFRPFKDLANVHDATAQIERVLGAVERYAAELPEAAWWRHGESLVIIIEQWF